MSWDESRVRRYQYLEWVDANIDQVVAVCRPRSNYRVLDVGTGTGAMALALAFHVKEVCAIDSSEAMLEEARARIGAIDNVSFENVDICDMSYPDRFDLATMRMVLHHVEYPELAVPNISKSLRKGGRLVVVEGVPPPGCYEWYREMFSHKESRSCYTVDSLCCEVVCGGELKLKNVETYIQKNMSLLRWLENSLPISLEDVWRIHVDAPGYVKKAYNMRFVGGDILMDWQSVIVVGEKE